MKQLRSLMLLCTSVALAMMVLGMKFLAEDPFDPLKPYIVLAVVFVVTLALKFIAGFGITIQPDSWLDGLAYAVGSAITLFLNEYALHLPVFVQPFVPLIVQGILLWLASLGIKLAMGHSKSAWRALAAKAR